MILVRNKTSPDDIHGLHAAEGQACPFTSARAEEARVRTWKQPVLSECTAALDGYSGILTTCGGTTSHAAVVARSMGRPCVAGAGQHERVSLKQEIFDRRIGLLRSADLIDLLQDIWRLMK